MIRIRMETVSASPLPLNAAAISCIPSRHQRIEEIARSMSRSMSCPLTLKTRKGYYDGNDVSAME